MNKLSIARRAAVLHALCEGNSIRATCRLTNTAKGTVLRLLMDAGEACEAFHDARVRNVAATQVQCDEVWSFVGCKERRAQQTAQFDVGDAWTWVALDSDSKLAISYLVGRRGVGEAETFMLDLRCRLANRIQLSTDGHRPYRPAVAAAFGSRHVDFAQVIKTFATPVQEGSARYSPPVVTGIEKLTICGNPDEKLISTSHVERQNLTMRMQMRRLTRLTNAFSKKLANHCAAVALNFVFYNWCAPHGTLTKAAHGIKTTPAIAAGLTDHVWTLSELLGAFENEKAN